MNPPINPPNIVASVMADVRRVQAELLERCHHDLADMAPEFVVGGTVNL